MGVGLRLLRRTRRIKCLERRSLGRGPIKTLFFSVLFVAHLLDPVNHLAILLFLNRNVGHGRSWWDLCPTVVNQLY